MVDSSSDSVVTFALYRYTPSIPAAVVMAVAFGFLGVFHAYRLIREKTYFFIPFIIGLICKFSLSPSSKTAFLTYQIYSRSSRLHRTHILTLRHPSARPLHRSNNAHPSRASVIRCIYLYDSGTTHPGDRCGDGIACSH